MKLEIDMPEHHYNNIIAFDSVSLGRVPYKGIIMYAINAIKRGKTLEQEPKTGHWTEEFNDLEGEVRFTCSCCGKYQLFGTDFCYHCGAKMVEPQESEGK